MASLSPTFGICGEVAQLAATGPSLTFACWFFLLEALVARAAASSGGAGGWERHGQYCNEVAG